ncbi:hypothetical protein [Haloquadratum walsbyi]|uniref:Uncharacterized protein n=1 Tax=Haloquadratum walsbyi J07HQW2 TaxID=1238425 RepID=U1PRA1_9EURY|nr:hypothetical protein [Haloquadratum walsbyi]ERG96297.1 MAG: hypothetical protein J07HQW2_02772 [Haloquadratum walsbyi J07HQW2]
MSNEIPDRPQQSGLIDALQVPRNAIIGVGVGTGLAIVVYIARVFEILGPFAGTRQYPVVGPEGWFIVLAFVLATSTALLVTTMLTVVSAIRLIREL